MRCLVASLLLVAVGCVESGTSIRPAPYFHDEPLFDVWAADPQVGTVLIRYRATDVDSDAGRIEVIAAVETLFWALH